MNGDVAYAVRPRRGDRRAPVIVLLIVAIVVALAVMRELAAPAIPFGDGGELLGQAESQPNFIRPIGLLLDILLELVALTALARVLDRRGWRPVPFIVATGLLSIVLATVYAIILKLAIHAGEPVTRAFLSGPIGGLQIYALWVLAYRYPRLADDARVRALEAEQLRQAAELSRLREHLQPHFLRNTLNAIAASVVDEPGEARNLLAALGDLLTESIENEGPTQTLGDEIAWLRRYGEIFEARHRGALRFVWDTDPRADAAVVPRLLLQPLVENAVRHGALARDGGGEVVVRTRRTDEGIEVVVADDGPGFDPRRESKGLGLRLVRRRLALECKGSTFRIDSSPAGTRAIVALP
ncbi:MAG TPA: histidine kinase [Haliangiales bacterium]|nr:histidine kinase [Haliangiales bacterium]